MKGALLAGGLLLLGVGIYLQPTGSGAAALVPVAPLDVKAPIPVESVRVPHIVIHKSKRVLLLYDGGTLVRRYPVGLGPSPEGDKTREGDGTTPIGTYVVCTRNERSRFHLFLGLSYPGPKDADRGLREGRIARRQHEAIGTAFVQGRQPPWDTPLGGAIGIHGGGAGRDWTLGCIALANEDVEELWAVAALGTPVVIEP